ncbi:unnamed protein product, partial [Iphiclides podalirius]
MAQTIILLMFAVLLAAVPCRGEYGQFYCGRRLATTLAFLCDNAPSVKRAGQEPEGVTWMSMARHVPRSMGRSKRQVASECCTQALHRRRADLLLPGLMYHSECLERGRDDVI